MREKKILLKGTPASVGEMIMGKVNIILDPSQCSEMAEGEILVTRMTSPLFTAAILKASALVTDFGGALSHAAVVARELNIPAIVGTKRATKVLKDGMSIMLDGKRGVIYEPIK